MFLIINLIMGTHSEDILDGFVDEMGEYIDGKAPGYPRSNKRKIPFVKDTPAQAKIRAIRKELAILIQQKQKTCKTEAEKNHAVTLARQEINIKYGKGWREEDYG